MAAAASVRAGVVGDWEALCVPLAAECCQTHFDFLGQPVGRLSLSHGRTVSPVALLLPSV